MIRIDSNDSKKSMKIIYFVINDISMPGGLARVTLNLYKQFTEKYSHKYSIKILTASVSDKAFIINSNIINLALPSVHQQNKVQKAFWYISFVFHINKYFKSNHADIIIGVGVMMSLCLSFCAIKNSKVFAAEHGAYGYHSKFICFIRKILYKRLNLVISLTKVDELKYRTFHPNVKTIPNFTTFFKSKCRSTLDNRIILSVGRFTEEKGYDILITFIKPFFINNPDWQLVLVGEGPLLKDLSAKVKFLELENNIKFKDPTKRIEVEYLSSSLYIMVSRTEGLPMVLLEAQAFGLPIISFDCPTGPSEIIHNGQDGFLIPMYDNELFLEKLDLLANNYSLRKKMGAQAIQNVKKFHPAKVMKQWESILDE